MNSRLPDFVIIGAQKAASTFLLACLRQHADTWLPAKEEPVFRDPVYSKMALHALAEKYARRTNQRLGLKCPDYLGRPEVPIRLHKDLSEPQLVVCLRNPVQRAVSAYFWRMRWGLIPVTPAEEGLQRILDGKYRDYDPTVGEVLDWGLYHQHLSRYLEYFPRQKILVLFDDDLRHAPEAVLRETHHFLGIHPQGMPTLRNESNTGIYSLERLRFLQASNKYILQWDAGLTYASIRYPPNRAIRAYCYGIAGIDRYCLSKRYANDKPTLSVELINRLWQFYADDVNALQGLVTRDLSCWSPQ